MKSNHNSKKEKIKYSEKDVKSQVINSIVMGGQNNNSFNVFNINVTSSINNNNSNTLNNNTNTQQSSTSTTTNNPLISPK